MFYIGDGLYFGRNDDGSVTIVKKDSEYVDAKVVFSQTVDKDSWVSMVLTMTKFSERPGDFHAFLSHHEGQKDILEGQRGGY
jgi:hypothetical protein